MNAPSPELLESLLTVCHVTGKILCAIKISQNEDRSFGLLFNIIFDDPEEFIRSFHRVFVTVRSSMEVDIVNQACGLAAYRDPIELNSSLSVNLYERESDREA